MQNDLIKDVSVPGLNVPEPKKVQAPPAVVLSPDFEIDSAPGLTPQEFFKVFEDAYLMVKARWYWGLLAALIVGGGLGYLLSKRPVVFHARSVVLAQGALDKVLGEAGVKASDNAKESDLRNHLSMMQSRKFRAKLIASFTPEEAQQIVGPYLKPGQTFSAEDFDAYIERAITVDRERQREVYTVDFNHVDREVALLVANRFTSEYIDLIQQDYRRAAKQGYDMLLRQASVLNEGIAKVEQEMLEYRKQNKIISRVDNQGILTDRLRRIDGSLTDIRIKRLQLETTVAQAKADRARTDMPWDNPYLATFANNEPLRQTLDNLMAQRALLASKFGSEHFKMKEVDASISGVTQSLLRNFSVAVSDLETQLSTTRQSETQLQREFEESFNSSVEVEKLASQLQVLGTEASAKRETLSQLQRKIGEAALSTDLPPDFMQVVDPAYIVVTTGVKKLAVPIALSIFVGFVFLGTPILLGLLDEKVRGSKDVEGQLGVRLVGAIHKLAQRREDRPHVVRNRTDAVTSEAFASVAGQLQIFSNNRFPLTVLISSTMPEEGKSTVSNNLAAAFTNLGKKVVLVDLDLRRPVLHAYNSVESKKGFLTWARAGQELDVRVPVATQVPVTKLADGTDLIIAAGSDSQPTRFFISKGMGDFVRLLQSEYDVVILDTPPSGPFQDALVLSRYAQQRLLVVREGKVPLVQVQKVVEDFDKASLPFTGLVLNGFNPHLANKKLAYSYKASQYSYGYKYADDADGEDVKK